MDNDIDSGIHDFPIYEEPLSISDDEASPNPVSPFADKWRDASEQLPTSGPSDEQQDAPSTPTRPEDAVLEPSTQPARNLVRDVMNSWNETPGTRIDTSSPFSSRSFDDPIHPGSALSSSDVSPTHRLSIPDFPMPPAPAALTPFNTGSDEPPIPIKGIQTSPDLEFKVEHLAAPQGEIEEQAHEKAQSEDDYPASSEPPTIPLDLQTTCVRTIDGDLYYRLSETIPYLLGPAEYLRAIDIIKAFTIPTIPLKDRHTGQPLVDHSALGERDRAILAMCVFAAQPAEQHSEMVQRWLAPFVLRENRVVLWRDEGRGVVKEVALGVWDFGFALREWQVLNPFLIHYFETATHSSTSGSSSPEAQEIQHMNLQKIHHWTILLDHLRHRRIPIDVLTPSTFASLTRTTSLSALDPIFADLAAAAQRSDTRFPAPGPRGRAVQRGRGGVKTTTKTPTGLYTMRFSHKHGGPYIPDSYSPIRKPKSKSKSKDPSTEKPLSGDPTENPQSLPKVSVSELVRRETRCSQVCRGMLQIVAGLSVVGVLLTFCYFNVGSKKKGFAAGGFGGQTNV